MFRHGSGAAVKANHHPLKTRCWIRSSIVFTESSRTSRLRSDPKTFEVSCQKDGKSYPVADLSDGEKQVLAMLADLTSCAPPNAVFLVDEPELNLHPLLACRLWNVIESELPDAIFVYGTHCISFAMRRA